MQQNMERPLHFLTTIVLHIHMDPTNSAWWSRCLSKPCGSQSRVIYVPYIWNFGTKMAIALTKIHATKHGTASPFSNYQCISHPYGSNKQCLVIWMSIKALWKSFKSDLFAVDLKFWNWNGNSPDQDPCNKTWNDLSIFQLLLYFTSIWIQQTVVGDLDVYHGPVEVIQEWFICRGLEISELKWQ
jgi:hypothetical protein